MNYKYISSQDELNYIVTSAHSRMESHQDVAKKFNSLIDNYLFFKDEKDALLQAINLIKKNPVRCQVWATIKNVNGIYKYDKWIATTDVKIMQAAEYIGMDLVYDKDTIDYIIYKNINIADIIDK